MSPFLTSSSLILLPLDKLTSRLAAKSKTHDVLTLIKKDGKSMLRKFSEKARSSLETKRNANKGRGLKYEFIFWGSQIFKFPRITVVKVYVIYAALSDLK